jgi:hypothetical protein
VKIEVQDFKLRDGEDKPYTVEHWQLMRLDLRLSLRQLYTN